MSIEKLYTVNQIAEMLSINPQTAMRFLREKRIKSIKIGREWRIKESAIEEYLSYPQEKLGNK